MEFKINQNQNIVLDLLAKSLFDKPFTQYNDPSINWSLVWHESYMQAVSLLVFSEFPWEVASDEKFSSLRQMLKSGLSANLCVNKEHLHLQRILSAENIPFVIIKGLSSAVYYPDVLLRSMGDVDFLIDEKDKERAIDALLKNGITESAKSHGDHIVFSNDISRFEMHFEPAGIPTGFSGDKIREMFCDILPENKVFSTPFGDINGPSAFHHGLIVLLHSCHHLTGEGIGLRHLCDWALFVSSMTDDEFRSLFEAKLKSVGLWKFAQILYATCEKYLSSPHRDWVGEVNEELTFRMIEDVFAGGNFGQKNNDRTHERMILPLYGDDSGKSDSYFRRFVVSMNNVVYANWRSAKKYKFLLPFGWLFFAGRYFIRSLAGKRPKIRPKQIYSEADNRTAFFNELSLFDTDK